MDYSIYDAIRAGFGKIVFIIRKTLQTTLKQSSTQAKRKIATEYVSRRKMHFCRK